MDWHKVDPVQEVTALLLTVPEAAQQLDALLAGKPQFLRQLPRANGEGWAAVFARPIAGENAPMLPNIPRALALYEVQAGWWFPTGTRLDVPDTARGELLQAFASDAGFVPPAIVVPRFDGETRSRMVDVYPVEPRAAALAQ